MRRFMRRTISGARAARIEESCEPKTPFRACLAPLQDSSRPVATHPGKLKETGGMPNARGLAAPALHAPQSAAKLRGAMHRCGGASSENRGYSVWFA
jgi:hypothetical protein